MIHKRIRCITGGLIPLALWGMSACSGLGRSSNAPTLVFSASTNSISQGQSVTLNWQTTNATTVTITATAGTSSRTVASTSTASGTINDSPTQTTTYSAVATGAHGSTPPQTATVQVAQPVLPTITAFTASPMYVSAGQPSTITWTTSNATSVTINPAVSQPEDTGPLPTSGSSLTTIPKTTTFTMTATGPGGTSAPATVTVTVPFTLSLTATPSTIPPGSSANLAWQVTGGTATSLAVKDGSGNTVCSPCALPQGTATVNPSATTTYTATAGVNATTSITQTATVTVSSASSGVIKHIFFMLQENRSFDMYLGQLGPYRTTRLAQYGISDSQTIDAFDPTVTLTSEQTGAKVQPFHETTECTENLTPAWDESHHDVTLSGGDGAWATTNSYTSSSFAMQGFLDTTDSVPQLYDPNGTRAMGYYNQTDIPYYYDLATFFGTSDEMHSPILANTVPNRMYLMAATSFGHEYPDGSSSHPPYSAPTIFRAMNTANVSWIYYYHDGIFLANFADYSDPNIGPKTFPVSDLLNRLAGTCSGGKCDPDKALPEVIFIDSASGSSGLDEHPDNNVQSGAAYVQSIISALMNSDAWQDSVFILSYDEGGGLYDHVAPINVPLPDSYAPGDCPDPNNGSPGYCTVGKLGGTFNLSGFRVPFTVISPYAKQHFVSHTPRDYTAILAFIESTFGVQALTSRDAYWQSSACSAQNGCADLSEFFDFSTPASLNGPNNQPWTQVLAAQPTSGLCDQTKEAGPTH